MSIAATCSDLRRWGKAGRGFGNLGFPTIVSFMKERLGRSVGTVTETDPVIDQIEKIVSHSPTATKEILIMYYCRGDSLRRIAMLCGCSKWSANKRLDEANWYVHTELDNAGQQVYISDRLRIAVDS